MKAFEFTLNRWPNHATEWMVRVTGRDPKFGYRREFCRVVDRNWSRSGKHGETRVLVEQPGLYEVSSPETGQYGREARAYCEVT